MPKVNSLTAQPGHKVSNSGPVSSVGPRRQNQWRVFRAWTYLFSELADPLYNALALVCPILDEQCLRPELEARIAVLLDHVQ
jgi:hypothetical protein